LSGLPFWGRTYYLWTKREVKNNNTFYVMQISRGPALRQAAPELENQAANMALSLADGETGRQYQERMINLAFLDEGGDSDFDEEGGTVTTASTIEEEDPFE
jgi:hypothetical protein